ANDAVSGPEAVEPEQTRRRSGRGQVVLLRPLEVALGAEAVGTERLLVPRAFVNVLLQGRVRARQPGDGVDTLDADDGCDVLRHIGKCVVEVEPDAATIAHRYEVGFHASAAADPGFRASR